MVEGEAMLKAGSINLQKRPLQAILKRDLSGRRTATVKDEYKEVFS